MWLLGFEPRSPRPQRGILTTKLQPQLSIYGNLMSFYLIQERRCVLASEYGKPCIVILMLLKTLG